MITIPADLGEVLDQAWERTRQTPGFLLENEARFLGLLAACTPAKGLIVEIGSFKGRSTVMLASVAAHYELGPVVSIDPHNFNLSTAEGPSSESGASTFEEFQNSLKVAGVTQHVEIHHAFSKEVSATWSRPIRLLWIDGDHSYPGTKDDFEGFSSHLNPEGIVAIHDSLNVFSGPIRVFVEDILHSAQYGPAGFVHSIAWGQYRPDDGKKFEDTRRQLERRAAKLLPFVQTGTQLQGLRKMRFKLNRSRIPRSPLSPEAWAALLEA